MINSVLNTILTYSLSFYRAPKKVFDFIRQNLKYLPMEWECELKVQALG